MQRIANTPRPAWQDAIRAHAESYADILLPADTPMSGWDESACYRLDLGEVMRLEAVTRELHEMCLNAARHAVREGRFADFGIPSWAVEPVSKSLTSLAPGIYGRFDLWYDGSSTPKLLEYHADTPSALVESAIVQWYWLEQTRPNQDQWNSLHERLVTAWHSIGRKLATPTVHFGWSDLDPTGTDLVHVGYLAETARQAGLVARMVPMRLIGWDGARFVDDSGTAIATCCKLYPWDWMIREPYGRLALVEPAPAVWVEPPWKLLMGSPAMLALLWELYPDHPNLLPAYLDRPRDLTGMVAKPLYAGAPPDSYCYRQSMPLPSFDNRLVTLLSWVVIDNNGHAQPAGAGFAESTSNGADSSARFVPHFVAR
jgi:glutathionylspermidine synthase